ncbi:unnamed protein product [Adineta steineri]|uniref:RRM domain-containing protein n=1 Tax=Adineta steineri TaxID=433720 RepID=A0A813VD03_9BILA|nr:unnamed protein product [Adineta steineri]CAF3724971.1 unnamed protein product [Adineta steineri]
MGTFSGYSSNILTIKNFPLLFNDNDRKEFLEHFGAVRVHCLTRLKSMSNIIIADFGVHTQASQALSRLHQLEILGRRLIVEYCLLELAYLAFSTSSPLNIDIDDSLLHGISPGKNQLRYSLPSDRLSYTYPPIDETILKNINNALLSIPAFYTQVLHLMNKMSLPCPMIVDSNNNHRTLSTNTVACQTNESSEVVNMDTDDDESEIDDGEEEERVKQHRRSILRAAIHQTTVSATQMDVTMDVETKKKSTIKLILPQTLDRSRKEDSHATLTDNTVYNFGRLEPTQPINNSIIQEEEEEQQQQLPPLPLIPLEELVRNRLSEDQLRLFDNGRLYRNYARGQPSQRLYIKNIDIKNVNERILHSLYDRYRQNSFEIDIHLMREGKMKGQAFVTFPNEVMALNALNDTNGFILHEKPIVVQFARTAKPKDII